MEFLERHNLSLGKIAKGFGVVVLGLIVLYVAFGVVGSILPSSSSSRQYAATGFGNDSLSLGGGSFFESAGIMDKSLSNFSLSSRNVIGNNADFSPGSDNEDFEVTEYRATIETIKLERACDTIMSLKEKKYVIFESSNKGNNNCNFKFKVEKDSAEEILAVIESLNPRELNERIETIKKQIDDFTNTEEILKRKLKTIEDTLSSAVSSYNEISRVATQARDANSLASIIESKIKIIERLSQEKINISVQLENIGRMKAEKIDKLEYTYFNINIYENKYVDLNALKDSWKRSIKSFVVDMNGIFQDLSIGLVTLVAYTFQYLLYLLMIVLTGKYVWKLFKRIWRS